MAKHETDTIKLTIRTADQDLETDLLASDALHPGIRLALAPNQAKTDGQTPPKRMLGIGETLTVILSFSIGIASSFIANYLYERLKGRATLLKLNDKKMIINADEIRKFLDERSVELSSLTEKRHQERRPRAKPRKH